MSLPSDKSTVSFETCPFSFFFLSIIEFFCSLLISNLAENNTRV